MNLLRPIIKKRVQVFIQVTMDVKINGGRCDFVLKLRKKHMVKANPHTSWEEICGIACYIIVLW